MRKKHQLGTHAFESFLEMQFEPRQEPVEARVEVRKALVGVKKELAKQEKTDGENEDRKPEEKPEAKPIRPGPEITGRARSRSIKELIGKT